MNKNRFTTCPNCGENYDRFLLRCPHCRTGNDERPNTNVTYLPIGRQITLFVVGLIGLNALAFIYSLFVAIFIKDEAPLYLTINSLSYVTLLIIDVSVINKYFPDMFVSFKRWQTYLTGILGFGVLVGSSMLISYIGSLIVPEAGTGENQSVAVMMVLYNPIISIFILGLIGPFVEECAYRIGLFSLCKRASRVLAYILSIIVFALIHINFFSDNLVNELLALPDYLVAATIFCVIYDFEGFGAAFLAHTLNNLFSIIMIIATKGA